MQRVHFIAIGGAAMHNLAIAVSKKSNFYVTGSDDEIPESAYTDLKTNKLLPENLGWYPDRIQKTLFAVVVGMDVLPDNPELLRARELKLKIYSFPEFLFQQTRSKTRLVVAGSHGKTLIATLIVYVMKHLRMDADYLIGARTGAPECLINLSYESRIAVLEGDEKTISFQHDEPRFLMYKPHIAVITCVDSKGNAAYAEEFMKFVDSMEFQGRLIYFGGDLELKRISENIRRDMVAFEYKTPKFIQEDGVTKLKTRKGYVPVPFTEEYHLQDVEAARLACRQIGITDDQFYGIVENFPGVENQSLKELLEK